MFSLYSSRNIEKVPYSGLQKHLHHSGEIWDLPQVWKETRREVGREGEAVCYVHVPTLLLLDGQHGQSIDGLVGGERSTQGTAQEVLEEEKTI